MTFVQQEKKQGEKIHGKGLLKDDFSEWCEIGEGIN